MAVGSLFLPSQSVDNQMNVNKDSLQFNPWNQLKAHRPIGALQRLRKDLYPLHQKHRFDLSGDCPFAHGFPPEHKSVLPIGPIQIAVKPRVPDNPSEHKTIPYALKHSLSSLVVETEEARNCDAGTQFWIITAKRMHASAKATKAIDVKPSIPDRKRILETKDVAGIKMFTHDGDLAGVEFIDGLKLSVIIESTKLPIHDPIQICKNSYELRELIKTEFGAAFPSHEVEWSDWDSFRTLTDFTFSGIASCKY